MPIKWKQTNILDESLPNISEPPMESITDTNEILRKNSNNIELVYQKRQIDGQCCEAPTRIVKYRIYIAQTLQERLMALPQRFIINILKQF
jgi:hypothetical protein